MGTNSFGMHHLHIRKRIHKKHEPYPHPDKIKRYFDKVIYLIAFFGPLMTLPQLLQIWIYREAGGVSVISWTGFCVFSVMWLIYGFLHKEKPLIVMYFSLSILQAIIAAGAYMFG